MMLVYDHPEAVTESQVARGVGGVDQGARPAGPASGSFAPRMLTSPR